MTEPVERMGTIAYRTAHGVDIAIQRRNVVPSDSGPSTLDVLISKEARATTLRIWVGGTLIYQAPAGGQ